MSLLDKASLICTPNAVKAGKLYSIVPSSGTGDMDVARATTATRVNSLGLIENVALNVARLNYDTVGGCPSILVEPQRTNLILNSATVATQLITKSGVPTTLSFYGTGTITLSGTYIGSLVGTAVNNRVTLTFTPTAGTLTLTVVGSCTNGQLEDGSYATSYIPTLATIQTRNADIISKTGISSLIGQTEGTIFVDWLNKTDVGNIITVSGNSNTDWFKITKYLTLIIINVTKNSVEVAAYNNPLSLNQRYKIAISYIQNNIKIYINGILVLTDASNTIPITDKINIGSYIFNNDVLSDGINSVQIYKTQLTNQECINLTTL